MRIAVNVRLLLKNRLEGIGWFTFETIKRITSMHPEHEFIFIFDRPFDSGFIFSSNVKPVVLRPPTRHPILYFLWFEIFLPRLLRKEKIDLFLSPDGFLSLRYHKPQVAVIHDINFAHRPKDLPLLYRTYYNFFFPRYARRAARIATVSEYSKNDIVSTYSIDKSNVDVVYNGVNEMYGPLNSDVQAVVRTEYSGGYPYFLFVGAFSARKNIKGLIEAFDIFKRKDRSGMKLILVGRPLFSDSTLKKVYENLQFKSDILFVGRQSPENLHRIVASAYALTFVPFFEGFGIPVAEAIQCEVPLICSNTTSIPEVAGSAALFVDPTNVQQIADAMREIIENKAVYENLKKATILQKNHFTWDKSAARLWNTVEYVAKQLLNENH